MVVFLCCGCNETLKKAVVDKHAGICRSCWAVTCLDCNVTFEGNDYAAHITCVSEAEKYEKTLYKGKAKKATANPQDAWMALVRDAAGSASSAPAAIRGPLARMAELSNVPRQEKKFLNFVTNSLNLRDPRAASQIWSHLSALREEQRQKSKAAEEQTDGAEAAKDTPARAASNGAKAAAGEPLPKRKKRAREEATRDGDAKRQHAGDAAEELPRDAAAGEDAAAQEEPRTDWPVAKTVKRLIKKAPGRALALKQLQKEVVTALGASAGDKKQIKSEVKALLRKGLPKAVQLGEDKVVRYYAVDQ